MQKQKKVVHGSKSLPDLLREGRHVAIVPKGSRAVCHGSRAVWLSGVPLLAVRMDPRCARAVQVLMPQTYEGAKPVRRIATVSLSDVRVCDGSLPAPAEMTAAERAKLAEADAAVKAFDERFSSESPAKIIPFDRDGAPSLKIAAVA